MRHNARLEQVLGKRFLANLLELAKMGMIEKHHLQRKSSSENLDVSSTFRVNSNLGTVTILERMLDEWYWNAVANIERGSERLLLFFSRYWRGLALA